MESDSDLMARAAPGDVRPFEALVERHRDRLEAFLYRLSWDWDKAEDCAQETFMRLWLARDKYDRGQTFTTYLYAIAHHCWIDYTRRSRTRPQTMPLEQQIGSGARRLLQRIVDEVEPPEKMVLLRFESFRIRQAITKLPQKQRLVFTLAAFEDLPYAEIAEILDIPVGTVKSRMHYALARLRNVLAE